MLFQLRKINFDDLIIKETLSLKGLSVTSNWDFYYNSYHYTLNKILQEGLNRHNFFNPGGRAFLFIFRHSWELCLKNNIHKNGKTPPLDHNLELLSDQFISHQDYHLIKTTFSQLNLHPETSDGSSLRYYECFDKDENRFIPFSDSRTQINALNFILSYDAFTKSIYDFECDNIFISEKYNSNIYKPYLVIYPSLYTLFQVKHQYDHLIDFLVDGIINKNFNKSKTLLPLFFLIRHSLELGLKANIFYIQSLDKDLIKKDIEGEHSLIKLFNVFTNFVDDAKSSLDIEYQHKANEYSIQLNKLNQIIQNLDKNSLFFRFPFGKKNEHKLNIEKKKNDFLIEILKLLKSTDDFITFTINVFEENGIIPPKA